LTANRQPDQFKEAQVHTDLLQQKQPNSPDTHIAIANLLNRQQKTAQALAEMQKALSLGPDRGDAYLDLAVLQGEANQPDAAEANYKKAIELKAPGANPRLALAAFYQSRSRYAEAEQEIKQVIASD